MCDRFVSLSGASAPVVVAPAPIATPSPVAVVPSPAPMTPAPVAVVPSPGLGTSPGWASWVAPGGADGSAVEGSPVSTVASGDGSDAGTPRSLVFGASGTPPKSAGLHDMRQMLGFNEKNEYIGDEAEREMKKSMENHYHAMLKRGAVLTGTRNNAKVHKSYDVDTRLTVIDVRVEAGGVSFVDVVWMYTDFEEALFIEDGKSPLKTMGKNKLTEKDTIAYTKELLNMAERVENLEKFVENTGNSIIMDTEMPTVGKSKYRDGDTADRSVALEHKPYTRGSVCRFTAVNKGNGWEVEFNDIMFRGISAPVLDTSEGKTKPSQSYYLYPNTKMEMTLFQSEANINAHLSKLYRENQPTYKKNEFVPGSTLNADLGGSSAVPNYRMIGRFILYGFTYFNIVLTDIKRYTFLSAWFDPNSAMPASDLFEENEKKTAFLSLLAIGKTGLQNAAPKLRMLKAGDTKATRDRESTARGGSVRLYWKYFNNTFLASPDFKTVYVRQPGFLVYIVRLAIKEWVVDQPESVWKLVKYFFKGWMAMLYGTTGVKLLEKDGKKSFLYEEVLKKRSEYAKNDRNKKEMDSVVGFIDNCINALVSMARNDQSAWIGSAVLLNEFYTRALKDQATDGALSMAVKIVLPSLYQTDMMTPKNMDDPPPTVYDYWCATESKVEHPDRLSTTVVLAGVDTTVPELHASVYAGVCSV
jgi:hypothetical protein